MLMSLNIRPTALFFMSNIGMFDPSFFILSFCSILSFRSTLSLLNLWSILKVWFALKIFRDWTIFDDFIRVIVRRLGLLFSSLWLLQSSAVSDSIFSNTQTSTTLLALRNSLVLATVMLRALDNLRSNSLIFLLSRLIECLCELWGWPLNVLPSFGSSFISSSESNCLISS